MHNRLLSPHSDVVSPTPYLTDSSLLSPFSPQFLHLDTPLTSAAPSRCGSIVSSSNSFLIPSIQHTVSRSATIPPSLPLRQIPGPHRLQGNKPVTLATTGHRVQPVTQKAGILKFSQAGRSVTPPLTARFSTSRDAKQPMTGSRLNQVVNIGDTLISEEGKPDCMPVRRTVPLLKR